MDNIDSRLLQLENAQLVRRLTEEELAFIFKHALTQEAAYESLLLKKRSDIHRMVAQSCERLYADRLDEFAAILARHYDLAGDKIKAGQYSIRAGDVAERLLAHVEAVAHYSRALELASPLAGEVGMSDFPTAPQLVHLYSSRGRALELNGQYVEAMANYDAMEKAGSANGDGALRLAALIERAKLYVIPNANRDPARGKALTMEALAVARDLNDRPAQSKILWNLMLSNLYGGGDLEEAAAYGEQSLALARELHLREQTAFTMNDLAVVYSHTGNNIRGLALLEESREKWRELGNLPMLTDNLGNSAIYCCFQGDYDQAIRFSDEAFELSHSIGNLWGEAHSRFLIGQVYLERGEWSKAVDLMEAAIRTGVQVRHPGVQVGTRADLAMAFGSMGAIHHAIELAQLAERSARSDFDVLLEWPLAVLARLYLLEGKVDEAEQVLKHGEKGLLSGRMFSPMLVALAEGELALAKGDYTDAMRIADELLAFLNKLKNRPFVVEALFLNAQALLGQSRGEEALECLKRAHGEAEALGSRRMLWQILALASEIDSRRGNEIQAQKLRRQAQEIAKYIADRVPSALKDSFLHVPRVQALMSAETRPS